MRNTKNYISEKAIENHLRLYRTYLVAIKNSEKQLEYIMPSLTTSYGENLNGSFFYVISDNTANFAIDRIESKRALDLKEEVRKYTLIVESIDNALEELTEQEQLFVRYRYFDYRNISEVKNKMGYAEDKTIYNIRRQILEKLMISLHNLLSF